MHDSHRSLIRAAACSVLPSQLISDAGSDSSSDSSSDDAGSGGAHSRTEPAPLPKATLIEKAINARIRVPVLGTADAVDKVLSQCKPHSQQSARGEDDFAMQFI